MLCKVCNFVWLISFIFCTNDRKLLYIALDVAENIKDNWTVQRQKIRSFSSLACDQTIEQTVNKDSKTKGGIVGFSLNKGAVHRWIMSQAERSAISGRCQEMANMSELTR